VIVTLSAFPFWIPETAESSRLAIDDPPSEFIAPIDDK
jgi:hypothetical protein